MASGDDLDVDWIIYCLLNAETGKNVELPEKEIRNLCLESRDIMLSQPMLLEMEAPINICGDIHGHFHSLLRLFKYGGYPPNTKYLFLGDYVDRGKQSIETICLLLSFKVKYPEQFFLLRGNHECGWLNRGYSFYDECKRRYTTKLWKTFSDCFDCMPVVAIIDEKIFCCHGGLSPELKSMDQVRKIRRPIDVPNEGLLCDLLWSDPDSNIDGWKHNTLRDISYVFGADVVHKFLKKHHLDLMCRAHQVVNGYEFFANRKFVTIFSTPDYCGKCNDGAIMMVDENLTLKFLKFESQQRLE